MLDVDYGMASPAVPAGTVPLSCMNSRHGKDQASRAIGIGPFNTEAHVEAAAHGRVAHPMKHENEKSGYLRFGIAVGIGVVIAFDIDCDPHPDADPDGGQLQKLFPEQRQKWSGSL